MHLYKSSYIKKVKIMARKTQISKEVILQTALEMLIENGYSSINIKTLSQKIGCSTQPLVWHFKNMEELRNSLSEYAVSYANKKLYDKCGNSIEAFENIGREYIKIAIHEPNLFSFLYLDNKGEESNPFSAIISSKRSAKLIEKISDFYSIPAEKVSQYLQNTVIYTHGIATLVATHIIVSTEDEMMKMINSAADAFLIQIDVPEDQTQ